MNRRRVLKGMCELALGAFLILLGLRWLASPPRASDPPELHAFYHRWLQPSWPLIVAPLAFVLLAPWVWTFAQIGWAYFEQWRTLRRFGRQARRAQRAYEQAECERLCCQCAAPVLEEWAGNPDALHCAACGRWLRSAYCASHVGRSS